MTNIVSFHSFHMAKNFPMVGRVIEFWASLAQSGTIPKRGDIDPRALGDSLPYIFLIDRIGQDQAQFRICGTYLVTLLGEDAKGRSFEDLFARHHLDHLTGILSDLWVKTVPAIFDIASEPSHSLDHGLTGKIALLPLLDAFGGQTKALGVLQTDGRIKYPPYTFDIKSKMDISDHQDLARAYTTLTDTRQGRFRIFR